jgi:flavin-dependent dehydrogenase
MTSPFDICVLGGGLAGSAFAILMARQGARVALIEKSRFDHFRAGEHLPPSARGALRTLGCEAELFDDSLIESPGILSRWVGRAAVFKPYIGHPDGFGFNLSRRRFDQALFRQAERAGVTTYRDAAGLVETARAKNGWTLSFSSGNARLHLHARRMADATGRISVFARRQGAKWESFGDLIATVGRLRPVRAGPADNLCLNVEACEHGWWSLTPTRDDIIAAFYASAAAKRASGLDERDWWQWGLATAPGVRERLARTAAALEEVQTFPAFPRLLRRMHGPDWFAIGDAAATHDPLSGHGILYALESAFRAAEMAGADMPLERIGPLYEEAIAGRFARHIDNRAGAYAEAAPRFPRSPFWCEMTAARERLGGFPSYDAAAEAISLMC